VLDAGDVVEIRTSEQVQANDEWLKENYAITPVAQQHIKESLLRRFREPEGYDLIRQVLERYDYMLIQEDLEHEFQYLLQQHKLGTPQAFLERFSQQGQSPYTPEWVAEEIMKQIIERNDLVPFESPGQMRVPIVDMPSIIGRKYAQRLCHFCKPTYPRDMQIVGRLSKKGGDLVIHKEGCPHLTIRASEQQSQIHSMTWQLQPPTFRVAFFVTAHDCEALLLNIAEVVSKHHCNMLNMNAEVLKFDIAHFRFIFKAHSDTEVLDIWRELTRLDNVMKVSINAAATSQPIYHRLQKLRSQSADLLDKTTGDLLWEETLATLQRRSPVLKNPFDISRPATAKMFFGRTVETKTMQRELCDGEYGKALILYGPRRSGKSSICKNFLERHVGSPYWRVLFSLQNATQHNEETILAHLAQEVLREFHEQLQCSAPNLSDYTENDSQLRFKRVIQDCISRVPNTRLVLVLDEFGGALESYENHILEYRFFSYWKDLMNEVPQLSLVLAVPTSSHRLLISEKFSHAFSFAEYLPVMFLDNESAKRLLIDPLRDQQIALHPNTATFAAKLTGNNPYYMTMIGQQLVHQLNREPKKQVVANEDIRLVVDKIIEAGSNLNFAFYNRELQNATELRILEEFVDMANRLGQTVLPLKKLATSLGLPRDLVRQHLERLRNGLILEEITLMEGGKRFSANPYYSFKIELVRLWLDRNRWFFSQAA